MGKVVPKTQLKAPPQDVAYWLGGLRLNELRQSNYSANRCTDSMLSKDFKEFLSLLNARRVEYLVVGGYALAAHGHRRYAGDMDLWFNPTKPNIAALLTALDDFGFWALGVAPEDLRKAESVVQLGYPPSRIDLLSSIDGVRFSDCFNERMVLTLDQIDIPFINVRDFRINKFAVGRQKDLADIEALDGGQASA